MIRRRVTFKIAVAAGAALLAGALAACSGGGGGGGNAASSSTPIVVCSDEALSGVYAQIGESDEWGTDAYFKHVNATGGILGHKVKYISLNNQSNAAQSELDAKKCIQTYHAQFIVGPESGADTESALPIAIQNKRPERCSSTMSAILSVMEPYEYRPARTGASLPAPCTTPAASVLMRLHRPRADC